MLHGNMAFPSGEVSVGTCELCSMVVVVVGKHSCVMKGGGCAAGSLGSPQGPP
jgi:hypothetical protein